MNKVFPVNYTDVNWFCETAMLAPTDEMVDKLGHELLQKLRYIRNDLIDNN